MTMPARRRVAIAIMLGGPVELSVLYQGDEYYEVNTR